MEQLKSDNREVTFWENLYHHYREYVEFLNDFTIFKPFSSILVLLPNIVMIMDLSVSFNQAAKDSPQNAQIATFFHNISYIGISQALVQILKSSFTLRCIILSAITLFLLTPLFTILKVLIETTCQSNLKKEIGHFRKRYECSLIHKLIRVFIVSFQYISMPVFTSVGIKLTVDNNGLNDSIGITFGTLILILVPVIYLIGEYHLLQIMDQNDRIQKQSLLLARVNFPNNLFDCGLVYFYFILINKLSGIFPFIIAMGVYALRLLIGIYFRYYQPGLLKEQFYILVSSLVTIIGIFIGYLCKEIYIVVLCILVLLVLLSSMKSKINFKNNSHYDPLDTEEKFIPQLQKMIWKSGTFSYAFRELIFQSRKNYSYRKQLLIEILKIKCYELESKSRGGAKMTNTEDLLKFETLFTSFLGNMLLIGDNSISILRLLQNKDLKRQIFAHEVKLLVSKIDENKEIISRMRQINDISSEGVVLMKIMFNEFYNDAEFVKDMEQKSRLYITSLAQKQIKTRLFNKKTTAIFINILDEPGKITRISKNLPAVLGHAPTDLLGKSINQIIPFTIQPFHDDILIKFVQKYSKKTMRNDPKIQFFAYNKDFHLQECNIRYNFVMSYFSSFELSGVVRKIEEEHKNVILLNNDGILEGWTEELSDTFGFDEFEMGECLKFNIMPLFPSLIKYTQAGGCNVKTVFFRPAKVKQKALQITEFRNLKGKELFEKQISVFKYLLENDELIEAYLADINYEILTFCEGRANLKKIQIKNFERIQNFNEIQDSIIKTLNGEKKQENEEEEDLNEKDQQKQASVSEYSMLGDQLENSKQIDSNFTLDQSKPNAFKKQEIRFQSEVSKSQLSIEFNEGNPFEEDHLINDEINANVSEQQGNDSLIEASFSPKLQAQTNFIPLLIFIAMCFIGITTWDQVVISSTQALMQQQCQSVRDRNKALMIYAKSSFNPNSSYIREYDNGRLMESSNFLGDQSFDYRTYLGDVITQNRFYMFNIQIPATLDKILMASTDARKAEYQKQIEYNFQNVMQAWIDRFYQSEQEWSGIIKKVEKDFTIRLIIISIGSIAFSFFLVYIYMQYRKQRKMTEAFFKFEKTDLDEKMAAIRKVIKNLEIKAMEWHLDKQFYEFVKKKEITNLQFQMDGTAFETKIKFQTSDEAEEKLAKKKLNNGLFLIVIFLLTQIVFIVLYSVLNFKQIKNFEVLPHELNKACKLFVLPNLMLANMFYKVPNDLMVNYKDIQTQVLEKPLESVPGLFYLLDDAPCLDCKFMFPLLTTNFRSFYSTFEQVVKEKIKNQDFEIKDLFYAVDVVVQRVTSSLTMKELIFLPATVFLYIFSLTVFFLSIYFNIRKMIEQNEKLEVFLKYFDEQILVKNKHMNGLLNKNT